MKSLKLADDLSLPIEAVTEVLGFLGRRGQGKSYAAQRLAELFHEVGAQFVVLDQVGIWWGLRLAADGKSAGIPIPVLGGLHGDIPLEATAGRLIADLVADRSISVVLDVSQFESDAAKNRFVHDFMDRFYYRLKSEPHAVHVYLEECQEAVPQNPQGQGEKDTLHVIQRAIKLGRNYGMGFSLISQRPQEVHKKVLNLAEVLFAFQLTGLHERKAVAGWIEDKAINEDIGQELPKLERGHPHLWSPAWLKVSRVVHITRRWTFDASQTPKVGVGQKPRELGPIDLADLQKQMAATIERAKQDDPRELRRQLAALKQQAAAKPAATAPAPAKVVRRQVQIIRPAEVKRLELLFDKLLKLAQPGAVALITEPITKAATELGKVVDRMSTALAANWEAENPVPSWPPVPSVPRRAEVFPSRQQGKSAAADSVASTFSGRVHRAPNTTSLKAGELPTRLTGPEQRILDALAWLEVIGVTEPEQPAVAFLAGYTFGGGAFNNPRGALRTRGLVEYRGDRLVLTDAGRSAAHVPDAPLSTDELHRRVLDRLPGPERRLLQPLLDAYPRSLSQEQLAEAAGYTAGAGAFNNPRGRLRSLGLVDYPQPGQIVARPLLFLDGRGRP